MRSSQKSGRGRGKGNRSNKGAAHSPNRVYESAGPEGKVRGTPQQIIDKYQQLARDAQLSGDRVNAENFLQHAEHYARILVTIQEEQERRNQQVQQNQPNRRNDNDDQDDDQDNGGDAQRGQSARPARHAPSSDDQPPSDGLAALGGDDNTGPDIVETPEARSPRPQRSRRPRPKPQEAKTDDKSSSAEEGPAPAETDAG